MNKKRKVFTILDILLLIFPLAGTTYFIKDASDSLSFSGFMGLFVLLFLIPCWVALTGTVILLLLFLKRQGTALGAVSFALQILSPLPLLLVFPPDSISSLTWYEYSMFAQIAAGMVGLLFLFIQENPAKRKEPKE